MASTWNTAQSGQWSVAANWTGGIPNANNAIANFTTLGAVASPWSITLAGATETVGTLNVSASAIEHYDFDSGTLAMKITSLVRGATAAINVSSANTSSFSALDSTLTLDLLSNTTIDNLTAGTFDVAAKITGAGSLLATGLGTVQIDNSNNNWTGGLFIEGGAVRTLAANVLAGGALDVDAASAILDLNGYSQTVANLTGSGTIETFSGNATLTVNESSNTTFSGMFEDGIYGFVSSAALSLTKTGAATLTLAGENITQGAVTINQGAIKLGADDALSIYSNVSIASGASLDLGGFDTQLETVSGTGSIVNSGSGTNYLQLTGASTFAGSISGAINVQLDYPFTIFTLSGTNTYTGATVLTNGSTLKAGASGAFSTASTYDLGANNSIDLNGFNETISFLSGSGKITNNTSGVSSSTLTFQNNGITIYTGAIVDGAGGGTVGLDVSGAGDLVLAGANTYSGGTTIEAGATLEAGAVNGLSANSIVDVKANGELDLAGYNVAIAGVTDSGTVTSSIGGAVTLTVGASSFAGAITDGSGVVGLTVAAGAAFHLSGDSNTYSGTTNIGAGAKLYGDGFDALSANSVVNIASGGQLILSGYDQTIGGLTGSGTVAVSLSGYVTLTVDESASSTFAGQFIPGSGGSSPNLTKTGAGTLTLAGNNTQAGDMSVEAGTLAAGAANAFTGTHAVVVFANATLDLGGYDQTIADFASSVGGGGTLTNSGSAAATLTVSGTQSYFAGDIKDGAGAVGLSLAATAVLGLGGVGAYSGSTRIGAGAKLYAGGTNAFSASSSLSIGISGVLDLQGYNQAIGAISGTGSIVNNGGGAATLTESNAAATSFTGVLADGTSALAFVKQGAGMLTLSGPNSYTGATTVSAGTLDIQSSSALGAAAAGTTVANGATLKIDGDGLSIGEALTINSGGILLNADTGSSGNTLTGALVNNGQIQAVAGTLQVNNAVSGSGSVVLTTGGSAVFNAAFNQNVAFQGSGALTVHAAYAGVVSGFGANDEITFANVAYAASDFVTYVGNSAGSGGKVTLEDATGTAVAAFQVSGSYNPSQFALVSSGGHLGVIQAAGHTPPTKGDLNGDHKSDILFEGSSGLASWQMNDNAINGGGNIGNPGTAWTVQGEADFDGDGKSDVLWRNQNGTLDIWEISGTTIKGGGGIGNPGAQWRVVGTGDVNNDGDGDILFGDAGGDIAVWEMSGTTVLASATLGNPGAGWKFLGLGDFNGDGKSDVLFENASGQYATWLINGTKIIGGATLGTLGGDWVFKGLGDFNGDGLSDILFENVKTGLYATWDVTNDAVTGGGNIGTPGSSWSFAGTGDYNGNGKSDILFRNALNGQYSTWDLNDTAVVGGGSVGNPGGAFSLTGTAPAGVSEPAATIVFRNAAGSLATWTITNGAVTGGGTLGSPGAAYTALGVGDFYGDGQSDVLFKNTNGTYAVWRTNGSSITSSGNIGAASGYTFKGLGDFNGDGISDLLFQNASGTYATWEINGTSIIGGAALGNPGANFTYAGVGDFNGDGTSDVLFKDGSGNYWTWLVDNDGVTSTAEIGNPGSGWSLKGIGDLNGDGKADLLFENASGVYSSWDLNGGAIVGGGTIGNPGSQYTYAGIADLSSSNFASILFEDTSGHVATWLMNDSTIAGGATLGAASGFTVLAAR